MSNERRPKVVCLIGSTRFRAAFEKAFREEEHAGCICLTVPCYKDDSCCKSPNDWARLDELHLRKIEMSAEILVVSENGYIGSSTFNEITYALTMGKSIRWLEPKAEETYRVMAKRKKDVGRDSREDASSA